MSRILPIARVGLSPLGHTATQFMMPLQRNTLNGSCSSARRSRVAVSRESTRKRYDCNKPAGPTNLSGFHQNEGQDVEQQAHKIHSYRPFNSSRSMGDCRRSRSGGGVALIKYGMTEWN